MRKLLWIVGLLTCVVARGATGDITATVNPDGWSANLSVAGFSPGATYNFGLSGFTPGANTPYFTVVSKGFDQTGTATTVTRKVYLTTNVDVPYGTSVIPGTYTSGTFTDGETVTEAVTGATAVVVGIGQTTGFTGLRVKLVTGSPATGHAWQGGSSSALFAQVGSISTVTLPAKDELNTGTALITRIALSDYIYVKDNTGGGNSGTAPTFTAPGHSGSVYFIQDTGGGNTYSNVATAASVTQNSTQTFNGTGTGIIGRFLTLPYKHLTGSFTVEAQAFNRHGMNGQPVACVKFTLTDGTISPRVTTVTSMTKSADDGLPVYAVTDTASNFTQAANVVCQMQVYPWIGDTPLDSSANAWQNTGMNLSNLPVGVCDKAGTYGVTYCPIDFTNGSDSNSGASFAYGTQAAAEAVSAGSRVKTMGQAMFNVAAYNNANNSRNTIDAGVGLLYGTNNVIGNGTHTPAGYSACAFTVMPASTQTQASAIITGPDTNSNVFPSILRLYNLTIAPTGTQLLGEPINQSPILIENCICTGQNSGTKPFSNQTDGKASTMVKNTVITLWPNFLNGNDNPNLLARGVTISDVTAFASNNSRAMVGCTFHDTVGASGFYDLGAKDYTDNGNIIVSFCKAYSLQEYFTNLDDASYTVQDIAVIENVMERIGSGGSPLAEISANPISSVLWWQNTSAGDRVNTEGDITNGTSGVNHVYQLCSFKYNSWYYNGTHNPGDVHATDGALIGQWPYSQYDLGWAGSNSEINPDQSPGNWLGPLSTTQTVAGYTSDLSKEGVIAIPGSFVSGTFIDGETVQQGGGVTVIKVGAQSSGTTLICRLQLGAADGSTQWVGVTSNAKFNPSGVPPTGTGGGNYVPLSTSILLNKIPSNAAVISYDLAGNPIKDDGTGAAGAFQMPPLVSGANFLWWP